MQQTRVSALKKYRFGVRECLDIHTGIYTTSGKTSRYVFTKLLTCNFDTHIYLLWLSSHRGVRAYGNCDDFMRFVMEDMLGSTTFAEWEASLVAKRAG